MSLGKHVEEYYIQPAEALNYSKITNEMWMCCVAACECSDVGSLGGECDPQTGQCECRERFAGRSCDRCQVSVDVYLTVLQQKTKVLDL